MRNDCPSDDQHSKCANPSGSAASNISCNVIGKGLVVREVADDVVVVVDGMVVVVVVIFVAWIGSSLSSFAAVVVVLLLLLVL